MMKRIFAIGALSLLVAAALPLAAQSGQTERLTANVPFDFTVAGKTMPAGEYEVVRNSTSFALVIRGLDRQTSAIAIVTGGSIQTPNPASDTKLVFNRYGNRYFLHQVVNGYASQQFLLPVVRAEREMASTASLNQEQVLAVLARR